MTTATYTGSVASALARCRKLLKKAGLPIGKITGRYYSFGSAQEVIPGFNVCRIGCGNKVSIRTFRVGGQHAEAIAPALAVLREAGLPFDERGWMECAYD